MTKTLNPYTDQPARVIWQNGYAARQSGEVRNVQASPVWAEGWNACDADMMAYLESLHILHRRGPEIDFKRDNLMPPQPTHPVQKHGGRNPRISTKVTERAYEVYEHLFGKNEKLRDGECGGFGAGELAALLYARSFPTREWRMRFDQAMDGMADL